MALKTRLLTAAAAAGATVFMAAGAIAQQPAQTTPAPMTTEDIAPVTDTEVDSFLAANTEVTEISSTANAELETATDQAAAEEIQIDANTRIVAAIEAEGLTTQRYTEIIMLAQQDSEFADRLMSEMDG